MENAVFDKHVSQLKQRWPLIGGWLRCRAALALGASGRSAAIPLLLSTADETDPKTVQAIRRALGNLPTPELQSLLCREFLDRGNVLAGEIAVEATFAPDDPGERSLFYFLTQQWECLAEADKELTHLRGLLASASAMRRDQIATVAQLGRRLDWALAVAGPSPVVRAEELTATEWQAATELFALEGRWADLWRLVDQATLRQATEILHRLSASEWRPVESERNRYDQLIRLAKATQQLTGFDRIGPAVHCGLGKDGIRSLAFDPSGRFVAAGGSSARIWTIPAGKPAYQFDPKFHYPRPVVFSSDGRLFAAADANQIYVWDLPEGRLRHKLDKPPMATYCIAFTPDGSYLFAGGSKGSCGGILRCWDLKTGKDNGEGFYLTQEAIERIVITPDGTTAYTGEYSGTVGVWAIAKWQRFGENHLGHWKQHPLKITGMAMTVDGRWYATSSDDGTICVSCRRKGADKPLPASAQALRGVAHSSRMTALALDPCGRWVAGVCNNGRVYVWSLPDQRLLGDFGTSYSADCLAASPDGQLLAVPDQSSANRIHLYSMPDCKCIHTLEVEHGRHISQLAFSPDSWVLAASSWRHPVSGQREDAVHLWEVGWLTLPNRPATRMSDLVQAALQAALGGTVIEPQRAALELLQALMQSRPVAQP